MPFWYISLCQRVGFTFTGDGIKMGEAIGARSIDLEWVQAGCRRRLVANWTRQISGVRHDFLSFNLMSATTSVSQLSKRELVNPSAFASVALHKKRNDPKYRVANLFSSSHSGNHSFSLNLT